MRNTLKLTNLLGARKLEEITTTHGGDYFLGSSDVGVETTSWSRKVIWYKSKKYGPPGTREYMRNTLKLTKLLGARKLEEITTTHGGDYFFGSSDVGVETMSWSRKDIWYKSKKVRTTRY